MRQRSKGIGPLILLSALMVLAVPLEAQDECPAAANPGAAAGWEAYGENRIPRAETAFREALERCPAHISARAGLAYVHLREGRDEQARTLFQELLAEAPRNTDVLTGLGLLAWRAGELERVADYFTRVNELNPGDPTALDYLERLPEGLADEVWRTGDVVTARRLYAARLEDDPTDGAALHRMALMEAWEEGYDESLALFDRLLALQPGNADARVDRARVVAWTGDIDGALGQLEALLDEDPSNVAALEAAAQVQAWAGEHDASLSTYDELLAVQPGNVAARRSRAQTLAWASRFDAAEERYREILREDPDDLDARLALARVLGLDDRLDAALAEYDRILERDAGNREALRGRARTLTWGGRLPEGEAAWRSVLAEDPDDMEARIGLGQNLRWQGRHFAARDLLREAERRDPNNEDVQEQLRWIHAATGPRAAPDLVVESDSDDNLMITTSITGSWYPLDRLNVRLDGYRRDTEQRDLRNSSVGVTLTGSFQIEPGWTVFAGVGGSESDVDATSAFTHLALGAGSPGRYPMGATFTARRAALDATALLVQRGVVMEQLSLDGRWSHGSGWRANANVGLARFRANETNDRWNVSASATRRITGPWTGGISVRSFGFEEDLNEGYFDPDRYWIGELVGGWLWEPGRWSASIELAPGLQQVGSEGDVRGAIRANTRLTYRVAPGRQISAGFGYSSTGLQSFATGDSGYEYRAFLLSASWVVGERTEAGGR